MDFHDIFAGHQFDIGMTEKFKVKLTPKDNSPAYSQILAAPINLKEDILVEIAMLHIYIIITSIASILAICKPNICAEKDKRETPNISQLAKNQQPNFGQLHQQ